MDDGPEGASGLDAAARTLREDIKKDYTPDFSSSDNKKNELKEAEKSAANEISDGGKEDDLSGVKQNEESGGGLYSKVSSAAGRGRFRGKINKDGKLKGGKKGLLKKGGPAGLIVGLIILVGTMMGGSQFLLPFSLVSVSTELFNSMHISTAARSNRVLDFQMSGKYKNPIKSGLFKDKFSISNRQKSKLAKYGIEYDGDYNDTGVKALKYTDADTGELKIIVANDADVKKLGGLDGIETFKNAYNNDAGFFKSYNDGSLTWRGQIANWFGSITDRFLSGNNQTRNRWKNYSSDDSEDSGMKVVTDTMAKGADEIEEGGVKYSEYEVEEDEDGGTRVSRVEGDEEVSGQRTKLPKTEAEAKAQLETVGNDAAGKENKVGSTAQKVVNYTCLVMNVVGSIALTVTASQVIQLMNLTTSYFESIQKTQSGDSKDAPTNELMNTLTMPKDSNYEELARNDRPITAVDSEELGDGDSQNIVDGKIATLTTKEVEKKGKSALQSSGLSSFYSGQPVDANDASVKSFNVMGNLSPVVAGLGISMASFSSCAIAKVAANAYGAAKDFVVWIACIAGVVGSIPSGGASLSACGPALGDLVLGFITAAGIGLVLAAVISTVVPVFAKIFSRDLISNIGGEDLGNALASGANIYMGGAHRAQGGSLANREKYEEFALVQQQVLAEDARYERAVKDPFDATSQYTFLGTLVRQVMNLVTTNSIMSAVTNTGTVISSAIASINPTASAYNVAESLPDEKEYERNCPYLASIGAVGDAFCNPYIMTDMSTIGADPVAVINELDDNFMDDLDQNGNVSIKDDSDLAKYILFCDNRTSSFGIADQNIVSQVSDWGQVHTGNSSMDNVINGGIGSVPVIGDIIDVVDNQAALDNAGYVSGESCVAGNEVDYESSPDWEKAKYYQRFIEDQSLMESEGIIEESAVARFLDDYYEKNPLDNSYEGILARYSGLSKGTVVALLDVLEYGKFVDDYDPSGRIAFGEKPELKRKVRFDSENEVAENHFILLADIVYADLRTKNFVI